MGLQHVEPILTLSRRLWQEAKVKAARVQAVTPFLLEVEFEIYKARDLIFLPCKTVELCLYNHSSFLTLQTI